MRGVSVLVVDVHVLGESWETKLASCEAYMRARQVEVKSSKSIILPVYPSNSRGRKGPRNKNFSSNTAGRTRGGASELDAVLSNHAASSDKPKSTYPSYMSGKPPRPRPNGPSQAQELLARLQDRPSGTMLWLICACVVIFPLILCMAQYAVQFIIETLSFDLYVIIILF